jgi:hypothetical protein
MLSKVSKALSEVDTYVSGTKGNPAQKMTAGMNWREIDIRQPTDLPWGVSQWLTPYPTLESNQ